MKIVEKFPRQVREIENVFIPLQDGTKLAARIWLPADAEKNPVPAILEYLPYRKRDGTVDRDANTHPYFAGHGYACVRVDIRGSGDSEGVLKGEYLKQEQDDALEVLNWLAKQKWSTGKAGMIGISWGGFNGLQIAARRPKSLKAVVSICSTDDRYGDDIHYMGGCLLNDKMSWYSTMFSLNTAPPDPKIVGAKWRRMWMDRLEKSGFWFEEWLTHQRRDAFYKHGSVCEDWSRIQCPVYAVGGWADGYTNAVFRLLANLKGPKKGLIGPWAHKYPHFAKPGPRIGFLQECLRWWDHWLKGVETGIMDEPVLRAWIEDPAPPKPYYESRPGRWVAEPNWPSRSVTQQRRALKSQGLGRPGEAPDKSRATVMPMQTTGQAAAKWCPYGLVPDQSLDQRMEEGGQLVFDSERLAADIDILGFPTLELTLASDRAHAMIAATLSEIMPDGAITRVSYGLLNLTHRAGHEKPEALKPGKDYRVKVQLNAAGHRFAKGNKIRVALSSAYWPIAWPSPRAARLDLDLARCALILPARPARAEDKNLKPFQEAEGSPPVRATTIERPSNYWEVGFDTLTGKGFTRRSGNDGIRRLDDIDLEVGSWRDSHYSIAPDDPLSAKVDISSRRLYRRKDWSVESRTRIVMTSDETHFIVDATLDAFEGEQRAYSRNWSLRIRRDHV